ncbi:insulinase family protein, partial [Acinetobacter baumannii]
YAAGATLSGAVFEPRSTLLLYASVASGQAAEALAALREELQRALAEGFSEDEVARARRVWLDGRRRALASEAGLVRLLAGGLQSGRDFAALSDYD